MSFQMEKSVNLHNSAKSCLEYFWCMCYELKKKKRRKGTSLLRKRQFYVTAQEAKPLKSPLWTTSLRKKNTDLTWEEKTSIFWFTLVRYPLWKVVSQCKVMLVKETDVFWIRGPFADEFSISVLNTCKSLFFVPRKEWETRVSLFWRHSHKLCYCYVTNM